MFGFLLLFVLFVNIFRQKPLHKAIRRTFTGLIFAGFLIHTAGLIIRWYISGHAPWSNGYESVVYVAWAAMLAGFIFGRKYPMGIGTASFLAGIALFVAHLSWMNPEVTNLVSGVKIVLAYHSRGNYYCELRLYRVEYIPRNPGYYSDNSPEQK
jgi:ABC-type transport system involved in cytochrome c biogenesis permease subunit